MTVSVVLCCVLRDAAGCGASQRMNTLPEDKETNSSLVLICMDDMVQMRLKQISLNNDSMQLQESSGISCVTVKSACNVWDEWVLYIRAFYGMYHIS